MSKKPEGAEYSTWVQLKLEHTKNIVGSLMFLVNTTTRWDIFYAVMILTRSMFAPAYLHMVAAKHILRHLRGTPDLPTVYRRGDLKLTGFTDR